MKLTKQQTDIIIKNGQNQGFTGKDIIDSLVKNGYEPEGVNTEAIRQSFTTNNIQEQNNTLNTNNQPTQEGNYFSRVGGDFAKAGERIKSGIQKGADALSQNDNSLVGTVKAVGGLLGAGLHTAGEVAGATFSPITEAPVVKPVLDTVATNVSKLPIVSNVIKSGNELAQKHPESAQVISDLVNLASLGFGKTVEKPLADSVAKITPKVLEKPTNIIGEKLKNTSESLYKVGVPMQESTKIAQQSYEASKPSLFDRIGGLIGKDVKKSLDKPITEAQTAVRQGLVGTEWQLGVQAKSTSQNLWKNTIEPALESSNTKVNMKDFIQEVKKDIVSNTEDLTRRKELINALNKISTDYTKVSNVSLKKLQGYKEGWVSKVPESSYRGKPITGALNEVRDMLATKARTTIYDNAGEGIKQAYIDYGNLKSIAELGRKSVDQLRTKGITKQAWEFILDTAVVPISTATGQVLYRTGQGIEFIGKGGAKKVGDIIGKSSGAITGGTIKKTLSN